MMLGGAEGMAELGGIVVQPPQRLYSLCFGQNRTIALRQRSWVWTVSMKQFYFPQDLARATGVSESSLAARADSGRLECTRTAGGHRRIPWPRLSVHPRIQHLCGRSLHAWYYHAKSAGQEHRGVERVLQEMVLSGREEEAIGYLHEYLSGNGFASLCDGPVRHCLEQVGHAWAEPLTAKRRIFALLKGTVPSTSSCGRCNNAPYSAVSRDRSGRDWRAPPGDPYLVPSLCATLALGRWLADGELGTKARLRSCEPRCEPKPGWFGSAFPSNLLRPISVKGLRCF